MIIKTDNSSASSITNSTRRPKRCPLLRVAVLVAGIAGIAVGIAALAGAPHLHCLPLGFSAGIIPGGAALIIGGKYYYSANYKVKDLIDAINSCEATRILYEKAVKELKTHKGLDLKIQIKANPFQAYTDRIRGKIYLSPDLSPKMALFALVFELANVSQCHEFDLVEDRMRDLESTPEDFALDSEMLEVESAKILEQTLENAQAENPAWLPLYEITRKQPISQKTRADFEKILEKKDTKAHLFQHISHYIQAGNIYQSSFYQWGRKHLQWTGSRSFKKLSSTSS